MGLKARVKATGEIVEIYRFVDTEQNEWIDCYLDFLEPIATDYWTRLEHQAAIAAMGGMGGNAKYNDYAWVDMAEDAIRAAHALIQKLKEKEERK